MLYLSLELNYVIIRINHIMLRICVAIAIINMEEIKNHGNVIIKNCMPEDYVQHVTLNHIHW